MGMAASQSSLLYMFSRKNSLNNRLGELTLQKRALTREAKQISLDYNNAINKKMYKWTNGSSYQALTYASLMKPSALSQNKNYLITDLNDRVVLDSTYAEYARLFSPDGKPGAEWGGQTRLDILSKLTGVSTEQLKKYEELKMNCYQSEVEVQNIENQKPNPKNYNQQRTSLKDLINAFNKANPNVKIPIDTDTAVTITNGSTDLLNLSQLSAYLGSEKNQNAWKEAIEEVILLGCNPKEDTELFTSLGDNQYKANWDNLINALLACYAGHGGEIGTGSGNGYNDGKQILWFNPKDYSEYEAAMTQWEAKQKAATESLGQANSNFDALFSAETERLIKFYDTMFSAIAEKGWVFNENINDPSYLNEMLQNNQYMITVVERNSEYNDDSEEVSSRNEYNTSLTSQIPNIVTVNDSDARDDALVEYETKKKLISLKEERIDTEMKNKETELEAIKNMIESVNKVKNDNIERTFNWSA